MSFHEGSAWFLLLLAGLPLIWWPHLSRTRRSALLFSSIKPLQRQQATWAVYARYVVPLLRTGAVVLLVICIARLRKGNEETRVFAEGVAIQMVVDRSGSMQAMDFHIDGKPVDRLSAIKKVVREFVLGDDDGLAGRPDDLVGLIVFGTHADSLCPLTLDHDHLTKTLDGAEIATVNEEAATAIGDALALSVERLRMLEQQRNMDDTHKIKSKVVILLTDGENNAGDFEPAQAAEMAAAFGIKVYTIGVGSKGMAPMPGTDMFGRKTMQAVPVNIDEDTLREIAKITGGQYFRATDTRSLKAIYAKIDEMEKTKIEERRYMQYKELATAGLSVGPLTLPPLLLLALILLVLEIILSNTRFRKIP
ncbi:MAG: VWA domain-containing protein [Planctomycetes bacterium]|nr:VWA domain-containing protein [Planctomycetota bacterium]